MKIKLGEEYTGPGRADPNKTRDQREQELRYLVQTQAGKEVVEYYFSKYTGILEGKCPPAGLLTIETILSHEYS